MKKLLIVSLFSLFISAPANAVELKWHCKSWEAHTAHFSPAVYNQWRVQIRAMTYLQRMGHCVRGGGEATVMHKIGELTTLAPGAPESERKWWWAMMMKTKSGVVVYTVARRPS